MTHPVDALSAYLDRELPEADRRAVEAHLAGCAACARHLEELSAIDALARGAAEPAAPAGYFDALPGRVRARVREGRRRTLAPAWLLPLAAGIVVAVVAPLVLRESAERGPAAPAATVAAPPPPAAPPQAPAEAGPRKDDGGAQPRPSAARADERRQEAKTTAERAEPARPAQPEAARNRRAAPPREDSVREFAAPPAAAQDLAATAETGPPPAAREQEAVAGGVVGGTAEREKRERDATALAVGRAARSAPKAAAAPAAPPAEADRAFRDAAALPLTSTSAARRALEAWRRYVAAHPGGQADEARVRLVEAAVAVYRHSGEDGDRAAAVREAEAYLADPAAPQRARVRDALRALGAGG